ncbi:hypothetical protein JB92DRAFT_3112078 [Gautieria morchelliformis]|nr:hypothetical protein JB92DRAFT_3112078 [Gautieria morchelliformis]
MSHSVPSPVASLGPSGCLSTPEDIEEDPPVDWQMAEDAPDEEAGGYRSYHRALQEENTSDDGLHTQDHEVHIEDVPEEDLVHEEFPGPTGQTLGSAPSSFERLREQQCKGLHWRHRKFFWSEKLFKKL